MSEIKLTGTIVQVLPLMSGKSQRGNDWQKQTYVIEHESGQYPRRCAFDVMNDKIGQFAIKQGETVTVFLNIDCNEYQGKWYNSVMAWRVERPTQDAVQAQPAPAAPQTDPFAPSDGQLPF